MKFGGRAYMSGYQVGYVDVLRALGFLLRLVHRANEEALTTDTSQVNTIGIVILLCSIVAILSSLFRICFRSLRK